MTFGGRDVFSKVGTTGVDAARRQVNLCLEAGVNLFDTANCYSDGLSEEILSQGFCGSGRSGLPAWPPRA